MSYRTDRVSLEGRAGIAVVVAVTILGGCCSGADVDGGEADAGPCDLRESASALSGDGGTDCGEFEARTLLQPADWDAGLAAANAGVDCALSAQDAGRPFVLYIVFSGADSTTDEAFVRTPAGESLHFRQADVSFPPGRCPSPAALYEESCAGFSASELYLALIPDAGLPILSCTAPGPSTQVCGTNC